MQETIAEARMQATAAEEGVDHEPYFFFFLFTLKPSLALSDTQSL
jgi:hypothetical protein